MLPLVVPEKLGARKPKSCAPATAPSKSWNTVVPFLTLSMYRSYGPVSARSSMAKFMDSRMPQALGKLSGLLLEVGFHWIEWSVWAVVGVTVLPPAQPVFASL